MTEEETNLFDRLLLQAEVKISNVRLYVLPKLGQEIDRLTQWSDELEKKVKAARTGDETAMIELVKMAFPKQRGENG